MAETGLAYTATAATRAARVMAWDGMVVRCYQEKRMEVRLRDEEKRERKER